MKIFFVILIALGLINILAFYIYLKKVRKLRTEKVYKHVLISTNDKGYSSQLI